MSIPALDCLGEPPLERLDVSRVLTRKRPPLDNALQRLSHVEPGTSGRRPEQEDAVLSTPLHQTVTLVSCQILLASAQKVRVPAIAHSFGCDEQTVRNVIHGFNASGLAVLVAGSTRPHRLRTALRAEDGEQLRDLLHHSPREFGKTNGIWSLELVAVVCFEEGMTTTLISDESVRRALKRLGINWKRAKHWITSPDPQYLRKKTLVTI